MPHAIAMAPSPKIDRPDEAHEPIGDIDVRSGSRVDRIGLDIANGLRAIKDTGEWIIGSRDQYLLFGFRMAANPKFFEERQRRLLEEPQERRIIGVDGGT